MKYFLEMISIVKKQGSIALIQKDQPKNTNLGDYHQFFDLAKKAKVFVFKPKYSEPKEPEDVFDELGNPIRQKLDAPFSVFTIEMVGNHLVTVTPLSEPVKMDCYCLLCYEKSPSEFDYYAFVNFGGTKMVIQTNLFDSIAKDFVDRINTDRQGLEQVNKLTVLIDRKNQKYDHKLKTVIHIQSIKAIKQEINPETNLPVNWTHRFFQRGHWRTIDGVGKDREGIYCIEGKTWVKEAIKGPKDAPLINKTRLVKI